MTFPIIRREDTEYCPLLMCDRCKKHTRHTKGTKVNWAFTENSIHELKFPKFRIIEDPLDASKAETAMFRTAWKCEDCGRERVWGE